MLIPIILHPPPSHLPSPLPPPLARLSGSNEVVLIELQGTLDVTEGNKAGGVIGMFKIANDNPTLKIGHHLLEGKIVLLPKPLAILTRDDLEVPTGEDSTRYNVLTIVKRKILFSKRPVPIVAKQLQ